MSANPKFEKAKKLIFNFVTINALMFVISIISTGCAQPRTTPAVDNTQQVQNQGQQPKISLAPTAEASQTTEDMRTPSGESQMQKMPAPTKQELKNQITNQSTKQTMATPTKAPATPGPVGSIQSTPEKPTVKERASGKIETASQSMKGTTVLEETAAGTYIHILAEGFNPRSSYNLSLYDKADCKIAQLGKAPTSRPQRVLAKLPMSKQGKIKFTQFFEGLKVKGESGITNNSIIISENTSEQTNNINQPTNNSNQPTNIENQQTRVSAACVVLNN